MSSAPLLPLAATWPALRNLGCCDHIYVSCTCPLDIEATLLLCHYDRYAGDVLVGCSAQLLLLDDTHDSLCLLASSCPEHDWPGHLHADFWFGSDCAYAVQDVMFMLGTMLQVWLCF